MRKLTLLGLFGLLYTIPVLARPLQPLPASVVIQAERPSTTSLRAEMLEETSQSFLLQPESDMTIDRLSRLRFNTVYDSLTTITTYYDHHLLDQVTRTDNPYGHNRPGIGFNF